MKQREAPLQGILDLHCYSQFSFNFNERPTYRVYSGCTSFYFEFPITLPHIYQLLIIAYKLFEPGTLMDIC